MPKSLLSTIPKSKFPLHFDTYSRLDDELADAAGRFREIGHDEIGAKISEVQIALAEAWDLIAQTERMERQST